MKQWKCIQWVYRRSRKQKIGLACAAAFVLICAVLLYHFPVYRASMVCGDKYFEPWQLQMLYFRGTPGDRREAEQILEQARAAFEDRETPCNTYGEQDPRRAKHGALWRHVTGPEAAKMEYTLELLSAHLGMNEGYVWIQYSHDTFDENGARLRGGRKEAEFWTVQRVQGRWVVVDTRWEA